MKIQLKQEIADLAKLGGKGKIDCLSTLVHIPSALSWHHLDSVNADLKKLVAATH